MNAVSTRVKKPRSTSRRANCCRDVNSHKIIKFLAIAVMLTCGFPSSQAASQIRYSTVAGAGGVPLQVAEAGPESAAGILLIHGATLSGSSWLQQLNSTLAETYHLVAFDLRGHGDSGKPWDPDAYSDSKLWADDVAAVIAATGLQRPLIVAWSFGGHVTMDYIRHYSGTGVAGIVFVGSTGGMRPFPPPDAATAAEFARVGQLSMSPNAGDRLEAASAFVDGLHAQPIPDDIRDREIASVLAVTPRIRRAMQGRSLDNSDLIDKLTMPVLFISGDAERAAPESLLTDLAPELPDAAIVIYEDTGHMPFIEQTERFNRDIAAFADRAVRDRYTDQ